MKDYMGRKVHLINNKGEKLDVYTRDLVISEHNCDGKYDDYDLDVDWYLTNGYSKAEDMFRRIERGYGSISQEEICNNEWLTIDEAKEEAMKAISKEYEGH